MTRTHNDKPRRRPRAPLTIDAQSARRSPPPRREDDPSLGELMLEIVDTGITALEQLAWDARGVADQAVGLWQSIEQGSGDVAEDTREFTREAKRWPRRVARLTATGWTLARIAASYRMWDTRRAFLTPAQEEVAREEMHRRNARRFRDTSLRHGGAFLKIGQLMSCRPDVLPKPWIEELSTLQDQAAPVRFAEVRRLLEASFGKSLDELFASFEEAPIASASIGQVHRAVLHDGRTVAVKVQRPGLEEAIELDMALMRLFLDGMRNLLPPTDLDVITDEIERTVREELDYANEARWMRQARRFLAKKPGLIVPEVVDALSNAQVMTTVFVEGRKLTVVLDELQAQGDNAQVSELLGRLLDSYFTQILDAGFFQADPHPGNLLVTPDGDLVLLDFGCTMQLSENYRLGYKRVLQAGMTGDRQTIARTLAELGFVTRSGKPDTLLVFADALLEHIREAASNAGKGGMLWPTAEELKERQKRMMASANDDPVDRLPAEFIMIARVFGSLGGLFMHYKPQMDAVRYIIPHVLPGRS